VTGLARAGKTALLTSIAANLMARRDMVVRVAPAGAADMPRFDVRSRLAALAADPPHWPKPTDAVSLLVLDVDVPRPPLPPRRVRLEVLDYPGEWLLDLPLLGLGFAAWSAGVLRRLERRPEASAFLAFVHGLPAGAADEALAREGTALYRALRWRRAPGFVPAWLAGLLPLGGISKVAFAASKADHVAERQRGNLAALVADMTQAGPAQAASFALAAVRCTEDFVWTLEGRPVSAVRGRVEGQGMVGSYPGEVPDRVPGPDFWQHPFLQIPEFQPMRLPRDGLGGVPNVNLDRLLAFLLDDVL
jgi:predicted YcjX-like family ATPase